MRQIGREGKRIAGGQPEGAFRRVVIARQHFEVQVNAGRIARLPHHTERLAETDRLAFPYTGGKMVEVPIAREDTLAMIDDDMVMVSIKTE